jgi:hypothetical protein
MLAEAQTAWIGEVAEVLEEGGSGLAVHRVIPQHGSDNTLAEQNFLPQASPHITGESDDA